MSFRDVQERAKNAHTLGTATVTNKIERMHRRGREQQVRSVHGLSSDDCLLKEAQDQGWLGLYQCGGKQSEAGRIHNKKMKKQTARETNTVAGELKVINWLQRFANLGIRAMQGRRVPSRSQSVPPIPLNNACFAQNTRKMLSLPTKTLFVYEQATWFEGCALSVYQNQARCSPRSWNRWSAPLRFNTSRVFSGVLKSSWSATFFFSQGFLTCCHVPGEGYAGVE